MQSTFKPLSRRQLLGFGAVAAVAVSAPTAMRLMGENAPKTTADANTFDPTLEPLCTLKYCRNTEYRKLMRAPGAKSMVPGRAAPVSLDESPFGKTLLEVAKVNPAITRKDLTKFMAMVDDALTKTLPMEISVHLPNHPLVMMFPAVQVGERAPILPVLLTSKGEDCMAYDVDAAGSAIPRGSFKRTSNCGISVPCWDEMEGFGRRARRAKLGLEA